MNDVRYARAYPGLVLLILFACAACEREPELLFDGEYRDWEQTVSDPLTHPIPGHGERLRKIYINDIGTTVSPVPDGDGLRYEYPPGTIVLKEIYTDVEGSALESLTIMIKAPEDERAMQGWIWIGKDPETGAENVFSESRYCVDCHGSANRSHPYRDGNPTGEFRDYVFFPYRPDGDSGDDG